MRLTQLQPKVTLKPASSNAIRTSVQYMCRLYRVKIVTGRLANDILGFCNSCSGELE